MKPFIRRSLQAAATTSAVTLVAVTFLWLNVGAVSRWAMTPGDPFDAEVPPGAPDYADPAVWSALPDREDSADQAPPGHPAVAAADARVDLFYVHPTTYIGAHWNGPVDDPALNEATDRVATLIQASAFNNVAAVWGPRYRQANGTVFTRGSPDGERAIDLAYDDVRRAFLAFEARRGADRPFLLASHSQGTVLADRLLHEEISGTPRRDRLVAAWLIGGDLSKEGLKERAPDVPPCAAPDQVGCVVAFNARGATYVPSEFEMDRPDRRERLCVNPLSWTDDGARIGAERHRGAVFLDSDDPNPRPAFADARCEAGTLLIDHMEPAPRDLPSQILDRVLGVGNYHPIEYQAFYLDIRENARVRTEAFLRREAEEAPGDPLSGR